MNAKSSGTASEDVLKDLSRSCNYAATMAWADRHPWVGMTLFLAVMGSIIVLGIIGMFSRTGPTGAMGNWGTTRGTDLDPSRADIHGRLPRDPGYRGQGR